MRPINTIKSEWLKLQSVDRCKPDSRDQNWEDVRFTEMNAFVAILIFMSVCKYISYELYWSTTPTFDMPGVRNLMS